MKQEKRKGYIIRLSLNMVAALVDTATRYAGEDSSRFDRRTENALFNRGLIYSDLKLTPKGRAYLSMAKAEWHR